MNPFRETTRSLYDKTKRTNTQRCYDEPIDNLIIPTPPMRHHLSQTVTEPMPHVPMQTPPLHHMLAFS